ncbi:hypothetical protein [Natronobacterium texcoconense]|uniref:hypothetical protein n=1 Tax=Natronobacterium texcoconense TaxID=1095778 RepID=UPI0011134604|nr:hypothetical protein [Natronobacterium texcoconense]
MTATESTASDERRTNEIDRAVMFSYQYVPGGRFTIEDVLEWQPRSLEGAYRTYTITYENAPSYRAYLFVDVDDDRESETGGPESGTTLTTGRITGSPPETNRSYVTVDLEKPAMG